MTRPTISVLLSGVGGQGVVLASFVLSHVAIAEGYDVKQSEVHGMSQRGGSVTSHFRFGDRVWAPLVSPGAADILMAFESLEALRYINWLKPGGLLVYNAQRINPSPVAAGLATYPDDIDARITAAWPRVQCVKANELAAQAGTVKSANVVMLGAVSPALPFKQETWEAVIRTAVPPKSVDINMEAFRLGVATAADPGAGCATGLTGATGGA
jgi:indolepyruvate ferredoxin oxidoreductase, beta subunit